MAGWKDELQRLASEVGGRVRDELRDVAQAAARRAFDAVPYTVTPYAGFGTSTRVLVRGRAQKSDGDLSATDTDSTWRNVVNTIKRLDADPLPHAVVRVTVNGTTREVECDDEGFFRTWVECATPLPADRRWHEVTMELVGPRRPEETPASTTGHVLVAGPTARFGVISDIDDTVIQSRVTSFLQAARTVILGNARTRLPFPGVAAFYRALERGVGVGAGGDGNPIFYVSGSPWNLYDLIGQFFDLQGVPKGPISLRDWDVAPASLGSATRVKYKESSIREILDTHPALPFVLLGDSGQQDPEVYHAIVRDYPKRILAVYIRNVTSSPERSASIQKLAADVLAAGSTLVLADDTMAAATHAAEQGWIARDALPGIGADKRADEGKTDEKVATPEGGKDEGAPTVTIE
jgi:phosphatidate phosphatase APP1